MVKKDKLECGCSAEETPLPPGSGVVFFGCYGPENRDCIYSKIIQEETK